MKVVDKVHELDGKNQDMASEKAKVEKKNEALKTNLNAMAGQAVRKEAAALEQQVMADKAATGGPAPVTAQEGADLAQQLLDQAAKKNEEPAAAASGPAAPSAA